MVDEIKVPVRPVIDDSKLEAEARAAGEKTGKSFGSGLNKQLTVGSALKGFLAFSAVSRAVDAVGSAVRKSVTDLRDFSRGVAEINSILPANEKLTRASENALIGFSSQFASGPATQAQAFYNIVSAGVKGVTNQLDTLKIANKAAVAGLVDIDDSAKLLVSSINAYSQSGLTATKASDALFVAVREGQTTFGELASSLGNVTGIAASAGVEFSELTGAVAAFTKQGLKTDIAVTGLRQALVSVVKPTKEAKDEAKKLGLEFTTAAIKSKGLAGFLKDVQTRTNGNSLSLSKLFGNVRALTPILTTVNGNFAEFERILKQTADSAGATGVAFKVIAESLDFKLKKRAQEIQNFALVVLRSFQQAFGGAAASAIPSIEAIQNAVIGTLELVNRFLIAPFELFFNFVRTGFFQTLTVISSVLETIVKAVDGTLGTLLRSLNIGEALTDGLEAAVGAAEATTAEFFEKTSESVDKTFEGTIYDRTGKFIENVKTNVAESNAAILAGQAELAAAANTDQGGEGRTDKAKEDIVGLQTLFSELSAGFSATEKEIKAKTTGISKAALAVGQNIKKGIGQGIGAGFAAFGAALAKGENALDAFAKAFLATLGQMMIQQGTAFILQGLGFSVIPGLQGNGSSLIATGAALAALGGALTAVGGGGGAAGVGGEGAGGFGSFDSGSQFQTDQEEEREAPGTSVGVTINGDVLDSDETGLRIVTLLNEAFDKEGVVFRGAQVV